VLDLGAEKICAADLILIGWAEFLPAFFHDTNDRFVRTAVLVARAAKDCFEPILWKNNVLLAQKLGPE